MAGPVEDLRKSSKAEAGSKQIEQTNQSSDTEEIYNSNFKILFHIYFLLIYVNLSGRAAIHLG